MLYKFNSFKQLIGEGYDKITKLQSLWSDYGTIYRLAKDDGNSVIVKHINPPIFDHSQSWNSSISHQRKLQSYKIEYQWYSNYGKLCTSHSKIPKLLYAEAHDNEQIIVLEDLYCSGYPILKTSINADNTKVVLKWLANFHGKFLNIDPMDLWKIGSYWNLATRPDEYQVMPENELKKNAFLINDTLNQCQFKTIIHGDAKLANFCFSQDLSLVAAVDFQYVGGGCGMKDVAYFLGSCLNNAELKKHGHTLLSFYFEELEKVVSKKINFQDLESEWRNMYPLAWADFERFLMGWNPDHYKLTKYSKEMTLKALKSL